MAGTRLLVHTVFVVEFLSLVTLAAYFGLIRREDLLSVPLMQQNGRSLLQHVPNVLSEQLDYPPVTILVSTTQRTHWESLAGKLKSVSHNIKVVTLEDSQNSCENPMTHSENDLVICEGSKQGDRPHLVIHNTTTVLYHNSVAGRTFEVERLLFPSKSSRKKLQVTILVDQNVRKWKPYVEGINDWMVKQNLSEWPCLLEPPRVDFDVASDLETVLAVNEANQTNYRLDTHKITRYLQSSKKNTLHAFLYVPNQSPVNAVNEQGKVSSVVSAGNNIFIIIPESFSEGDGLEIALGRIVDLISSECMGIPKDLPTQMELEMEDSLAFPKWFLKLWYQDILQDTYQQVVEATLEERFLLLNAPRTVPMTENVASRWRKAVEWIEMAQNATRIGDYETALGSLDLAMEQIAELQKDPALLEPLDFPWDQYAAIFAPLLMPLLLPLLTGVVRETKRYRQQRKAQRDLKKKLL